MTDAVRVSSRWFGGQRLLGVRLQVRVGGVLSSLTTSVFGASTLPATSSAKNVTVVSPWAVILTVALGPFAVVFGMVWPPLAL